MAGTLTVIWWRDIPAQVVAKDGRRASKIVLHPRFQVAIDKAAVKAGKRAMDDYIAEWRKTQEPCGDDLDTVANDEAARLETAYGKVELAALVAGGGAASTPEGQAGAEAQA
ncbi:MAG: virulence factor [Candidatus Limnocylindrales bacterium]